MAPKEAQDITLDQMREAISHSGYLLEQRIKPKIERRGYLVEANKPYPDPQTGISREFDILAISGRLLYRRLRRGSDDPDLIFPYIICECENNTQPLVFFESHAQFNFHFHEDVKCSGMPVKIWNQGRWVRLSEVLRFERFHHYFHGRVATQYCSFSFTKNRWLATHLESQHQTMRNLINALEATIDNEFEEYTLPRKGREEAINLQFYYPVMILQGRLCLAKETRQGLQIRDVTHIQFRQEVWSTSLRSAYQCDVIQESFLGKYLNIIDREMKAVERRMRQHRDAIRASINRLVLLTRKRKKRTPFRQIHDFHDT